MNQKLIRGHLPFQLPLGRHSTLIILGGVIATLIGTVVSSFANDRCNGTAWTFKGASPATTEICVPKGECVKGHAGDVTCQKDESSHCPPNDDCQGGNKCHGGTDPNDRAQNWTPNAVPGTIACNKGYEPCIFTVTIPAGGALNCKCTCGNRVWVSRASRSREESLRKGRQFRERDTGNTVYVTGHKVVILDSKGVQVRQFRSSSASIQSKIKSGEWMPIEKK